MKIIKDMIETPSIPFSTIIKYGIIDNTMCIFEDIIKKKTEWGVEYLT